MRGQDLVFGIAALLLIIVLAFFAGYYWQKIEEKAGPRQETFFDRLLRRKI